MARLEISLLGGFQARLDAGPPLSFPTRKVEALLGYLAATPGRLHSRDRLALMLWGATQEDQARNSLRQALFLLRKALAGVRPEPLIVTAKTVTLNPFAADIDLVAFEQAAGKGEEADLQRAMELYRGELLEGFGSVREPGLEEWLLGEQGRLRELAVSAADRLLRLHVATASVERTIGTARQLLALDPLHEDVHRTLMRLYMRQGRWGSALRQYELCRNIVRRHLNVELEAETRQLYLEIVARRGDPGAAPEHGCTHCGSGATSTSRWRSDVGVP
jgi:DNA-binding SARP family transcriptional activator